MYPYGKMKMDFLLIYKKAKSNWDKNFHEKGEIINILEKNLREGTYSWGIEGLLNKTQMTLCTTQLSTD